MLIVASKEWRRFLGTLRGLNPGRFTVMTRPDGLPAARPVLISAVNGWAENGQSVPGRCS